MTLLYIHWIFLEKVQPLWQRWLECQHGSVTHKALCYATAEVSNLVDAEWVKVCSKHKVWTRDSPGPSPHCESPSYEWYVFEYDVKHQLNKEISKQRNTGSSITDGVSVPSRIWRWGSIGFEIGLLIFDMTILMSACLLAKNCSCDWKIGPYDAKACTRLL